MAETIKHESAHVAAESKAVLDTAKDKVKEVASGAADFASAARDKAKDLAVTAKDKVKDMVAATDELAVRAKEKVQDWTSTAADKTGETFQEVGQEFTALVRRYPVQSLLVGFAVGFFLARATTRS
jgi:ElaB/YqjD/DUF883 family membrane-anchored ribosome-binding protein